MDVDVLIGKTLVRVQQIEREQLLFLTSDGKVYRLYHAQECCETVTIEEIVGDLNDLVGTPLLVAEKQKSSDGSLADPPECVCGTWTFYKFSTIKGSVTIRWYGEGSGDYSEEVDFEEVMPE